MFKRKSLLSYLTAFFIIGFLYTPAYSYYYDSIDKIKFQGYNGEGSFVENPAYVGDCFGYVLLGMPLASIISWPQRIANYNEASDNLGVVILKCCTKPFGLFFGGFPYLLKKTFWDFPIWIGGGDVSSPSPYDYKPTPVPEPQVPAQLREEPRVKLNEASATTATPKLTEIKETAPLPGTKGELTRISPQAFSDTQKIPQLQPLPGTQSTQSPKVDIPSAEDNSNDQTPKSSSQSWESSNVPEWLNKDLAE
ncbi:MAG: hypothetical protein WCR55_11865 [Lentisphaerota bacterium]